MSILFWIALIILAIYLFQRVYFKRADTAQSTSPTPRETSKPVLPSAQSEKTITISTAEPPAAPSVTEAKVTPAAIPDAEPVGFDLQPKTVSDKPVNNTETVQEAAIEKPTIKVAPPASADETSEETAVHDPSPKRLKAPRGGKADKLIAISGIGNILQGKLFDLGIYHFDQLASLTPEQAKWVNQQIGFSGRIEREDWINQAAKLAATPPAPAPAKKSKTSAASTKGKSTKTKTSSKKKPAATKKASTTKKM